MSLLQTAEVYHSASDVSKVTEVNEDRGLGATVLVGVLTFFTFIAVITLAIHLV